MPENAERLTPPVRRVWRRSPETARIADSDMTPVCSGEVVTAEQEYQRMQALKRQMEQERRGAEAEREEAARRDAARHPSHHRKPSPDDEEDAEAAAERWRNDRYAVKLLRQEDSVWGGGGADAGMLG